MQKVQNFIQSLDTIKVVIWLILQIYFFARKNKWGCRKIMISHKIHAFLYKQHFF